MLASLVTTRASISCSAKLSRSRSSRPVTVIGGNGVVAGAYGLARAVVVILRPSVSAAGGVSSVLEEGGSGGDREFVSQPAEAGDDSGGNRRQHRGVPKRLARCGVREMQFHHGPVESSDSVMERPRRVAQRTRIDHQRVCPTTRAVDGL